MKFGIVSISFLSAAVLAGCGHRSDSASGVPIIAAAPSSPNDAIRTAIQAHLAHNGNLSLKSFDTEVKQVTFDGDRAQAQVEFHAKNGPGTMQLTYALTNRDGAWSVTGSTPGGGNFTHPGPGQSKAPVGTAAMSGDPSVFRALDNLHDRTAAKPQNLPPGHPPVAPSSKNANAQSP